VAWVARNFVSALACAAAAFVVIAVVGADPIEIGEYVFTLVLFGWLAWPLYMGALYLLSRRGRSACGRWCCARCSRSR
jgi:hypothetical protein